MKNAVTLKSFEPATREMSGDQYLTISKMIPLARSLQQLAAGSSTTITKLGNELMRRRFLNIESNPMLAASTLLDPRLKKVVFAADQGVRRLTVEMTASENTDTRE